MPMLPSNVRRRNPSHHHEVIRRRAEEGRKDDRMSSWERNPSIVFRAENQAILRLIAVHLHRHAHPPGMEALDDRVRTTTATTAGPAFLHGRSIDHGKVKPRNPLGCHLPGKAKVMEGDINDEIRRIRIGGYHLSAASRLQDLPPPRAREGPRPREEDARFPHVQWARRCRDGLPHRRPPIRRRRPLRHIGMCHGSVSGPHREVILRKKAPEGGYHGRVRYALFIRMMTPWNWWS